MAGTARGQAADVRRAVALVVVVLIRAALNTFLYFPEKEIAETPADRGLSSRELAIETDDGERLHGWWVQAQERSRGHVLHCHGNGGNVGDRVLNAELLCARGFDVLLFDYRGYGRSTGRPSEQGTYHDARAARAALLREPGTDGSRLLYLGESLGGAVALELALEFPPAGLILQSPFTSVRDMAREHYKIIPGALVPDAYPSLTLIPGLQAPLLVLHGDADEIAPVSHGQALFEAAAEPKQIQLFPGLGHELVSFAGAAWADAIAAFADGLFDRTAQGR